MNIKKVSFGLLNCLLTFSLLGCGSTSTVTSEGGSTIISAAETYKITFNTNGGTPVAAIQGEAGKAISAPAEPTKAGYTFAGWFTDSGFNKAYSFSTMPSSNIELFAKWTMATYTITYVLNGGENNPNNPSTYNILKKDIKLADPTNGEMYFAGWYLDGTFTLKITTIKTNSGTDYTLYAKWTEAEPVMNYNINYNLDGGVNSDQNPATFNSTMDNITLADPTKEGFEFMGWFLDSGFTSQLSIINTTWTADLDVYAKWESKANTYRVTYNLNGGTNGSNLARYKDTTPSFKLEPASRASSMFDGWYLDPEFTQPITEIDTSKKKDYTVYAKFIPGLNETVYSFDFGLESQHVIYHISDAHIVAGTSTREKNREAEEVSGWRLGFANGFNEIYNEDYLPTSSTGGLKNIVNYCETKNPDALVFSGDLMDEASEVNKKWAKTFFEGLKTPFVFALGNHEAPHSNFPVMPGMDTLEFTVLDCGEYEIIAMDNAISYGSNHNQYYFTANQYTKLRTEIEKNKPIIIVEHVPILTPYNSGTRLKGCGDTFYIDYENTDSTTKNVIKLMMENSCVKLVLCGHIHGGIRMDISATLPQISASSALMGNYNKIVLN